MPILLFVCVVVIATIAILTLRLLLQQELLGKNVRFGGEIGGAIGSSINAVVIVALNILYHVEQLGEPSNWNWVQRSIDDQSVSLSIR